VLVSPSLLLLLSLSSVDELDELAAFLFFPLSFFPSLFPFFALELLSVPFFFPFLAALSFSCSLTLLMLLPPLLLIALLLVPTSPCSGSSSLLPASPGSLAFVPLTPALTNSVITSLSYFFYRSLLSVSFICRWIPSR
jgi:hypothetical protein